MKKKGQALVEFIIILPVFIMLVLAVIDIGNILYSRIVLEDTIGNVIDLSKDNNLESIKEELDLNNNYELKIEQDGKYKKYVIVKKIDIITPGLNFIFDNPYPVTITRSVLNE